MATEGINAQAGREEGFISMAPRGKFLVTLFIIAIVFEVIATLSNVMELNLLTDILTDYYSVTESAVESNDNRQLLVGLAQIILLIVTAVVFLRWFYRSHANLKALEVEGLKYTPGWVVGYFFIPILNIIRPFQVAVEIWKASFSVSNKAEAWQKLNTPNCVSLWWLFLIFSGIIGNISVRLALKSDATIEDLILSSKLAIVTSAISVISTLFVIKVVKGIVAAQESKAKTFSARGLGGFTPDSIDDAVSDTAGDGQE